MKKILILIFVSLFLLSSCTEKEISYKPNNNVNTKILFGDSEKLHVFIKKGFYSWDKALQEGIIHCSKYNKFAFLIERGSFVKDDLDKKYISETNDNYIAERLNAGGHNVKEVICSNYELKFAPSTSIYSGNKIARNNYDPNKILVNNSGSSTLASNQNKSIEFTIKDKREQCEAIGFKPETEKFADCVLRLVELDVKQQTQNQITVAQNNGNDALVKQLERQNNLQLSQSLMNLGQELMNPTQYNSNIYMPQTTRCTMQGFGTFATMRCR